MSRPVKVFLSYAHADEKRRERLVKFLAQFQREGKIDIWHDRRITAGKEWAGVIDDNLKSADLVLLLVTEDFIASNYCMDVELECALQRQRDKAADVIPIIYSRADWKPTLGHLQALPDPDRPIAEWKPEEKGLEVVTEGIRRWLDEYQRAPDALDEWLKDLKTKVVDDVTIFLEDEKQKSVCKLLYPCFKITDSTKQKPGTLVVELTRANGDLDSIMKLMRLRKDLAGKRDASLDAIEQVIDLILPLHLDHDALRKGRQQLVQQSAVVVEGLVETELGAELVMSAHDKERVALKKVSRGKESEAGLPRLVGEYQEDDLEWPAPNRPSTALGNLHDVLKQMTSRLLDASSLRQLDNLKSQNEKRIEVFVEALQNHLSERKGVHGRTPFWVLINVDGLTKKQREVRWQTLADVRRRVPEVVFIELATSGVAGKTERKAISILRSRYET